MTDKSRKSSQAQVKNHCSVESSLVVIRVVLTKVSLLTPHLILDIYPLNICMFKCLHNTLYWHCIIVCCNTMYMYKHSKCFVSQNYGHFDFHQNLP